MLWPWKFSPGATQSLQQNRAKDSTLESKKDDTCVMNGKNRPLATDEPVEFEEKPVQDQNFRKTTDHFREIYRIYLNFIQEKPQDHNM